VAIIGQMHPDVAVRNAMARLVVHVSNAVTSATWLIANRVREEGRGGRKFDLLMARADHDASSALLPAIMDAVRAGTTDRLAGQVDQIEQKRQEAEDGSDDEKAE